MTRATPDVFIVIRSVQERTTQICEELVRQQANNQNQVICIHETPFAEAHLKSMELAIKRGAKWSVLLDADVLLRSNALDLMIQEAEKRGEFYMLNFGILDRGFMGPSYGVHFYPTHILSRAMQFADVARQAQKPETRICKEMVRLGVPTLVSQQVVALHGYEQYYADLYRTTFVRAVKFKYGEHLDYMLSAYRQNYHDDECRLMLLAAIDGHLFSKNNKIAPLEPTFYKEQAEKALKDVGLVEKTEIEFPNINVDKIIETHQVPKEYQQNADWLFPSVAEFSQPQPLRKRLGWAIRHNARRLLFGK